MSAALSSRRRRLIAPETTVLVPGIKLAEFGPNASWVAQSQVGEPAQSLVDDGLQFVNTDTTTDQVNRVRAYQYHPAGIDISNADGFSLRVKYNSAIPAYWQQATTNGLEVLLSSDGAGVYTNYKYMSVGGGSATGTPQYGVNTYTWAKSDFNGSGGTIDYTNITNIRLTLYSTNYTEDVTWMDLHVGRESEAWCVICMDDGDESQDAAVTTANAVGIPITLGIIQDLIDGVGYLTTAQLVTHHAAGNGIAPHGNTSWIDDADDGFASMQANRAFIANNALSNLSDRHHFAVSGEINADVVTVLGKVGALSCRVIRGLAYDAGPPIRYKTFGSKQTVATQYGVPNPYSVVATPVSGNTLATLEGYVDAAISAKETLILYLHTVGVSSDITSSDWSDLCDYIAAAVADGTIKVGTYGEWATRMGLQ